MIKSVYLWHGKTAKLPRDYLGKLVKIVPDVETKGWRVTIRNGSSTRIIICDCLKNTWLACTIYGNTLYEIERIDDTPLSYPIFHAEPLLPPTFLHPIVLFYDPTTSLTKCIGKLQQYNTKSANTLELQTATHRVVLESGKWLDVLRYDCLTHTAVVFGVTVSDAERVLVIKPCWAKNMSKPIFQQQLDERALFHFFATRQSKNQA